MTHGIFVNMIAQFIYWLDRCATILFIKHYNRPEVAWRRATLLHQLVT